MKVLSATQTEALSRSHLVSLGGHVVLVALALILPALGFFPKPDTDVEVMMVRLKGGGETIPGWIKPTTAPPDEAPVPDNKPQERPKPVEEAKPPEGSEVKQPVKEETAPPKPETKPDEAPPPSETAQEATEETVAEDSTGDADTSEEESSTGTSEETGSSQPAAAGETGAGVGAKPGPEGEGVGAASDTEFAGSNAFLSRVEAEVQRRFNFRGNASGKIAEYHFTLDKQGELHDLVLMVSSGVPSLDLAARSALLRANFPPLPRSFPHDRLGITYKFHGEPSR